MNANFWVCLDQLVASSHVTIDRPRGSLHPRLRKIVYPLDYGFLENTTAGDGAGIDVFLGSLEARVTGTLMAVDLEKRDAEMKILLGCSSTEMRVAHEFMNSQTFCGALLVREVQP